MGSNLKNSLIALVVPFPSIIFFLTACQNNTSSSSSNWCYSFHPMLLANILFFFNVTILFWLVALLQSSHWMIDLYWTVIPVLLGHYYAAHPVAQYDLWRSRVVILLTWVWSIRLGHSYFRRERWQCGAKEDWRFTDMGLHYGNNWWWVSFFAVYLSQQVFLIGVCIPLYIVHSVHHPLNIWDLVAIIVCLSGLLVAYYADTQLFNFVSRNNKLKALGKPMVPVLDEGLWHYSRHPNYFGEQFWWWGLAIFGWNLGFGWTFVGPLINSMCLAYVTLLVENRMLQQDYRAAVYRSYQKTTSVWVPWFKSNPAGEKDK